MMYQAWLKNRKLEKQYKKRECEAVLHNYKKRGLWDWKICATVNSVGYWKYCVNILTDIVSHIFGCMKCTKMRCSK